MLLELSTGQHFDDSEDRRTQQSTAFIQGGQTRSQYLPTGRRLRVPVTSRSSTNTTACDRAFYLGIPAVSGFKGLELWGESLLLHRPG